ncbi:hypothetical protein QE345_gp174 [Pseudomonas phage vB_PA45_GUMS]|uniref:Uncharacterized protein n=1 Tax=Pseudomonas phage vB_PA45_GUMS TaxID=2656517 RepID=A0A8T8BGK4_9CAUD|nr:hypothetical protein QE345_gp174 [Pseudomonas phage vB_PA45_GUMS]QGK90215.1 hypothetical protein [Pseudomonas phage vB_PA45_GUMS]
MRLELTKVWLKARCRDHFSFRPSNLALILGFEPRPYGLEDRCASVTLYEQLASLYRRPSLLSTLIWRADSDSNREYEDLESSRLPITLTDP